jgi:hypothetical protein
MKSILALATFALVVLALEDKARQVAGEAQDSVGDAVDRVRSVAAETRRSTQSRPLPALLIASAVGYGMSRLTGFVGK